VVSVADGIDRVLGWLKWPVALASLVLLPGAVDALYQVLRAIYRNPAPTYAFLGGALAFAIAWRLFLRRLSLGIYLMVLEHELTHALVAWATFHRVVQFRATVGSGGHVLIQGRGNWLITVAPYFFPTVPLVAIAVLHWLPHRYLAHGSAALGATVAYHVISRFTEIHRDQPDLRNVGWLFSALFLPSANAVGLGVILGFAAGIPALTVLHRVVDATRAFVGAVVLRA